MLFLKCVAAVALVALFSLAIWGITHLRGIRRELEANDALPRPVPRTNFLLFLSVVFIALSSLLIAFLFY